MTIHHQNWAGNTPYQSTRFHEPDTIEQLQEIVREADKVRVIGSRHCFTDIADTTGDLISLSQFHGELVIDRERHTATVPAGITYRALCPQLDQEGYALPNTASLDHITVIGACMSATHGSGDSLGNLATSVCELEIVTATGDLVTLSRDKDPDRFPGVVVALGALGVVSRVTLDLVPAFSVRQDVYTKLPFSQVFDKFEAIMGAGYSVSLFPTWQEDYVESVWVKRLTSDGECEPIEPEFFDGKLKDGHYWEEPSDRHWTPTQKPGPWYTRLPHFYFKDVDREGDELQSEYFVARGHAVDALKVVSDLSEHLEPILGVSEIRSVAADDLWLSTAYGQDVVGIHFNWRKDWQGVRTFLPILEERLAPFKPRPHWGKLSTIAPSQVQALYPKMADFQRLVRDLDPAGKFRNLYIDRYVFGVS
ncbi:MAG: FAD-binding protein [Candidatus Latescibacterota bacterium]|nr:FAD-binding protein [Candidatus Latescibacterota bacterium]